MLIKLLCTTLCLLLWIYYNHGYFILNSIIKAPNKVEIRPSYQNLKLTSNQILTENYDIIQNLKGGPELVDHLIKLSKTSPGIELDINLYRSFYDYSLDDFQVKGLEGLMAGNNVLVNPYTNNAYTIAFT